MGLVLWPIPENGRREKETGASIAAKKKPAKKPKTKKANSKKKTDTKKKTDESKNQVQKQKEHSAAGAQI